MPDVWCAIPGDLAALTGGYGYARRVMAGLPDHGWRPRHVALPAGFPHPTDIELATTSDILAALPESATVLVDGLAFGALPGALLDAVPRDYVALVHHPLARETGLEAAASRRFAISERAALARARAVIATSRHTADVLRDEYGVDAARLSVAPPGTDRAPRASPVNSVPRLLTVATLTPRKGHGDLVRALARVTDLSWRSCWVGSLTRDPATTSALRALIAANGLEDRIALRGELDGPALEAMYAGADMFVLPSLYEGYGMAFAEALARGIPVIGCAAGAVPATVPADAGLLVAPGDVDALAATLRRIVGDHGLRKSLADAAWTHGRSLPTWRDTAAAVAAALGPPLR